MSAAAASSMPHRLPGHPVTIPRVLVRNQALLVPAELRLALLLFDRMEREERYVPLADEEWTRYSGLDPRSKELAIKGLKQKGLLLTEGLGQRARYCTDTRGFMRWASVADRTKKPRTAGRGVTPAPKQKIHADCAAGGCSMLRQACGPRETGFVTSPVTVIRPASPQESFDYFASDKITPAVAPKEAEFAKPVSRNPEADLRRPRHLKRRLAAAQKPIHPPHVAAPSRVGPANSGTVSSDPRPAVQKPVQSAESSGVSADSLELAWPLTLARLAECGPLVGAAFLARLLAVIQSRYSGVTDAELTDAIERAGMSKATYQQSAGLFLKTVPDMLGAMRREHSPPVIRSPLDKRMECERLAILKAGERWPDLTSAEREDLIKRCESP